MLKTNRKIQTLTKQLAALKERNSKQVSKIETALQAEYNARFKVDKNLKDAVKRLEASNEYGENECGIYSWIRFDVSDYAECLDQLESFLSENCYRLDAEHDALMYDQGGCIVVNDDGDVYDQDSGKFIIDAKEYGGDTGKRNVLIEAWMHSSGYFPGVFSSDRHGNVFPINTMENIVSVSKSDQSKALSRMLDNEGIANCIRSSHDNALIVAESDAKNALELIKSCLNPSKES